MESVKQGYAAAERAVQDRPGQSVAMAFGLGVVAGLAAVLLMRERHEETKLSKAQTAAAQLGRHLVDAFTELKPETLLRRFRS